MCRKILNFFCIPFTFILSYFFFIPSYFYTFISLLCVYPSHVASTNPTQDPTTPPPSSTNVKQARAWVLLRRTSTMCKSTLESLINCQSAASIASIARPCLLDGQDPTTPPPVPNQHRCETGQDLGLVWVLLCTIMCTWVINQLSICCCKYCTPMSARWPDPPSTNVKQGQG